jgi:arylformamidase
LKVLYRAPDGTAFGSREEIEAQYDLPASVANYRRYADGWPIRSELARAELGGETGLPYGPTVHETLDIFPGRAGGPLVIFFHGGYWIELTSTEHSYLAPGLVANGATVVIPTYALCPIVTIDEIVRQARASVAWAFRNGARYGADPGRIVVVGHSAGGHLVACLLQTEWEGDYGIPSSVITGACAISGLFDLRPFPYTTMQERLELTAEQILRNSPILNLPVSAPPLLITHGANQPSELRRQSLDFYHAWRSAGLHAEYWERQGFNHFDELEALAEPDSDLTKRVLRLGALS